MSTGTAVFIFGLLLALTPAIVSMMETPDEADEADLWDWLMKKTLHQQVKMSVSIHAGLLFMVAGIALNLWEPTIDSHP